VAFVWYLGQDVPLAVTVLNDAGAAANASSVVVTVTNPDGTTQTPAVTNPGTGSYQAVVTAAAQPGTYLARWVATGSGFTFVYETQFQVQPSTVEQIVDLQSVKAHLNMIPTDTSQDAELLGFILAATPIIRDIIGPILPESHVQFFDGGVETISLPWQPVIAIQSIYEYYGLSSFLLTEQQLGQQMNAFAFTVDYVTGQVTRRTFGGQAAKFAIGDKNVKATWTAGRTDIPYNVRLGALELIRHNWQMTQQGGRGRMRSSVGGGGDEMSVPIGFAVPDRVVEMLGPHRRPPGIA
jgi:hypothetical protein